MSICPHGREASSFNAASLDNRDGLERINRVEMGRQAGVHFGFALADEEIIMGVGPADAPLARIRRDVL